MVLPKKVIFDIAERPINQPQAIDEIAEPGSVPGEVLRLQRRVEIRGRPDVLSGLSAEAAIGRIQLTRFGFQACSNLAAFRQKVVEPVVLLPVYCNRSLDTFGQGDLEPKLNSFMRPLDHPCHDGLAGVLEQVVSVVLI